MMQNLVSVYWYYLGGYPPGVGVPAAGDRPPAGPGPASNVSRTIEHDPLLMIRPWAGGVRAIETTRRKLEEKVRG